MSRAQRVAFDLGLAVACLLSAAPGLSAPFSHYDDPYYILFNEKLLQRPGFHGLATVWDDSRAWAGTDFEFFPLRDSVYWLLYQRWQFDPLPYHLTSLAFHIAATLLALRLALAIGASRWVAILSALIFASHPIHTEAVLWAAALKDPLYTTLMLGSLVAYLRYRDRANPAWYLASCLLLVGSLLAKSMAVATPLLMLALELWVGSRASWRTIATRLAGPTLIAAGFLAQFVMIGSLNRMLVGPHGGGWLGHYILAAWVQVLYLRQVLVPGSFRMIYCFDPPVSLLDARLFAALATFAGVSAFAWWSRGAPMRLLAIAWYVVCMLPSANILPIPPAMDDRFLYAATFGASLLIASLFAGLPPTLRNVVSVVTPLVLVTTSFLESTAWRVEENLWVDPDEDPACMTDPSFLASNAHFLRYQAATDRQVGLEACARGWRTQGLKGSWLTCRNGAEAIREAVELRRFDLADAWAPRLVRSCPYEAVAWNVAVEATIHRRPEVAAEAARRAWRLTRTPRASALRAITAAELWAPDAPRWANEAVAASADDACSPIHQWATEVPLYQVYFLWDAVAACSASMAWAVSPANETAPGAAHEVRTPSFPPRVE